MRGQSARQPVPSFSELAAALQPARLLASVSNAAASAGIAFAPGPKLWPLLPDMQLSNRSSVGR